eukprot:1837680-Pyramimonas_sp.AAC.1
MGAPEDPGSLWISYGSNPRSWLSFGFPMEAPQNPGFLVDFPWKHPKIPVFFWISNGSTPRC